MLNRIRNLLGGEAPRHILNRRLVPDPNRMSAKFDFKIQSLNAKSADIAREGQLELRAELKRQGIIDDTGGIPLNSPRLDSLYKCLKTLKESRYFRCCGEFTFALNPEAKPAWEWFEIHPHDHSPIDLQSWAFRADRMPSNLVWVYENFISSRSKRIIEDAGLTGLEFTWVRDAGRYQAEQWYHAMATKPLGRGLDHPFFDPSKFVQPEYRTRWGTLEEWRFGVYHLKKPDFSQTASFGIPAADGLLELCDPNSLEVKGFRQVLRDHIPAADFAYVWDYRLPVLCCNARARAVLLNNRLLSKDDFTPIWVWDSPPDGAVVLDRDGQKCVRPYPMPASLWESTLEKLNVERHLFLANPKLQCVTTAAEVLARFRASHPPKSASAAVPPRLASAADQLRLPKLWEEVLNSTGVYWMLTTWASEEETTGWEVVSLSELPEFQKMTEKSARHFIPDFPKNQTHFAHDGGGDWLSFDLNTVTPDGDCRVLHWRHDRLSVEQEWPSIVQLLEESLELAEKAESETED